MKRVLCIDRDGTLVAEPDDEQLDSFEKLRFLPEVITKLRSIANELNYELVMITNQDGLGTDSFPEEDFYPVHDLIINILENETIRFEEILIDRSFPHENKDTRKPGTGMLKRYLSGEYDLKNSFVIGDRYTDIELAANLGARGILLKDDQRELGKGETNNSQEQLDPVISLKAANWQEIYQFLRGKDRTMNTMRKTSETHIEISIDLDGHGNYDIKTGLGFFDHMLEQLARHGGIDLDIKVKGDLHIDEHHTIEDTGIALGEAVFSALGKKAGIDRYGFHLPMDDARATVLLDFGGRAWLEWKAEFNREKIGEMPTEMFSHFFRSFAEGSKCNLFIEAAGNNEHHKIEAIFKALARALKQAIARKEGDANLPTTKGIL